MNQEVRDALRAHHRYVILEYAKRVPGHQIQVDVKFLNLRTEDDRKIRRYQFTAIDDATRVRALKIYERHNQKSAIDFIDYVVEKFPFRIHTIRTDRGHEWQAQFHWHVEDKGMRHVYIKPRSPSIERQSRKVAQDRPGGVLPACDVHG